MVGGIIRRTQGLDVGLGFQFRVRGLVGNGR